MIPGIERQASTGVLYVSERAAANGWIQGEESEWAGLGQGAPETGPLPGGRDRIESINVAELGGDNLFEYAPVNGAKALRETVAKYYNDGFRVGMPSQYTSANVAIVPGGRAGLTRVASVIGEYYALFQVPEYTAYEQMLSNFHKLTPIPSTLSAADDFKLDIDKVKASIHEQGLSVVLLSNPKNPTGQVVHGDDLKALCEVSDEGVTLVLDEFYSQYIYDLGDGATVTAARYVKDVNKDSIILIDGLTKNYRYPGFRVAWVVGPESLIRAIGQSGGALDGGAAHLLQVAALTVFKEPERSQEQLALQNHFRMKRDYVLGRLAKMGLEVKNVPKSTFYIWLNLESLPEPLNNGLAFFEECLKQKVIVTPGIFFDLHPTKRSNLFTSPCHHYVRVSYGPSMTELKKGMDGFERVLHHIETQVAAGEDIHDVVGKDLKV